MKPTIDVLSQIFIFSSLSQPQLQELGADAELTDYLRGEIIMHEGDRLPGRLFALASGSIRITKTATSGKETILRVLSAGEIFAAPALFGNGIAPATVFAESNCQVLTVERDALLNAIRHTPEMALSMLAVFNQRLQQLHNTVHGLVSERAIVRLVRYIQFCAAEYGTEPATESTATESMIDGSRRIVSNPNAGNPNASKLLMPLPYYQVARSIGISYEECVRLFKQLQPIISYHRGGCITIHDWQQLDAIASGLSIP